MGFKLVDGEWLKMHSRKAASVFKETLEKGAEYSQAELMGVLADCGHVYTTPEFQLMRVELMNMGVLEGVEEPEPE